QILLYTICFEELLLHQHLFSSQVNSYVSSWRSHSRLRPNSSLLWARAFGDMSVNNIRTLLLSAYPAEMHLTHCACHMVAALVFLDIGPASWALANILALHPRFGLSIVLLILTWLPGTRFVAANAASSNEALWACLKPRIRPRGRAPRFC